VPPALLGVVATLEGGGLEARGAQGVMQLMPDTARQYGVSDIRNVRQNTEGSARLLSHLWTKYRGNIPVVLAAYNAGKLQTLRDCSKPSCLYCFGDSPDALPHEFTSGLIRADPRLPHQPRPGNRRPGICAGRSPERRRETAPSRLAVPALSKECSLNKKRKIINLHSTRQRQRP
jgi:hypothetical protein